jgi:hypothetical protein
MIQIEQANISSHSGPVRMLNLALKLRIRTAYTLIPWAKCELKFRDKHITPPFPLHEAPRLYKEEQQTWPSAQFPITRESIRFIEENRTDDVILMLELKYSSRQIDPSKPWGPIDILDILSSSDGYNSQTHQITIPQSNWIRELASLGWSEIELFEVDRRPLRQDKNLTIITAQLRQAERMFREGDHAAALTACHQAFVSLSKFEIAGTQHKGLDAVLNKCFRDPEKQKRIKDLLETTQSLCKLGSNEEYPQTPFSRVEVETQLKLTLSLFELLSHQLAESSAPRIID